MSQHLKLLASGVRLRDGVGAPLPAWPREGMLFEVRCRCGNRCLTFRVRRVNSRSFYISSWGKPPQRFPVEAWQEWLKARKREGDIRLARGVARERPLFIVIEGGRGR